MDAAEGRKQFPGELACGVESFAFPSVLRVPHKSTDNDSNIGALAALLLFFLLRLFECMLYVFLLFTDW